MDSWGDTISMYVCNGRVGVPSFIFSNLHVPVEGLTERFTLKI